MLVEDGGTLEVFLFVPAFTVEEAASAPKKTAATSRPASGKAKGRHHCSACGKAGHSKATCAGTEAEPKGQDGAKSFVGKPLTPDRMAAVRKLIGEGASSEFIEQEVGVGIERIEAIRAQMETHD